MPTTVNIQFNSQQILDNRGLGRDKKAQKFFTNEVFKHNQPYTPWDQGDLATTVTLEDDSITYISPYARYQYYGKVMAGPAPEQPTDKNLTYQGSPMRGAFWEKRMFANKGNEILQSVAKITGGTVK